MKRGLKEAVERAKIERATIERVDHPSHYGGDVVYEHHKVVRAWGLNYWLGQSTKYICRAGKKDPAAEIEDLEKAIWYLQAEIDYLKTVRK